MVNIYYKNTKKSFEQKHAKDIKILQKKKKKKGKKKDLRQILKRQYHHKCKRNLSEEEKEKKVEYMKNYYLAHKKYFLR